MKISTLLLASLMLTARICAAEGDVAVVGQPAPGFAGTTSDGQAFSLQAQTGKVVLVDFFATWCGPCMEEMPRLETEIWQRHQTDGLILVAVGREHNVQELAAFKAKKQFSFAILADPGREIYGKYATKFIPRCYLIGRDGTIKYAANGYRPAEFAELKKAVDAELAK